MKNTTDLRTILQTPRLRRALCMQSFEHFFAVYMAQPDFHKPGGFHEGVEGLLQQSKGQHIVFGFPKCGKTTYTIAYALWRILSKTSDYVLILTQSGDTADLLLERMREEIEESERLRANFPLLVEEIEWRGRRMIVGRNRSCVEVVPVTTPIKDKRYRRITPKFVLGDDMESEMILKKKQKRAELLDHIRARVEELGGTPCLFFSNKLHPNAPIEVLATGNLKRKEYPLVKKNGVRTWAGAYTPTAIRQLEKRIGKKKFLRLYKHQYGKVRGTFAEDRFTLVKKSDYVGASYVWVPAYGDTNAIDKNGTLIMFNYREKSLWARVIDCRDENVLIRQIEKDWKADIDSGGRFDSSFSWKVAMQSVMDELLEKTSPPPPYTPKTRTVYVPAVGGNASIVEQMRQYFNMHKIPVKFVMCKYGQKSLPKRMDLMKSLVQNCPIQIERSPEGKKAREHLLQYPDSSKRTEIEAIGLGLLLRCPLMQEQQPYTYSLDEKVYLGKTPPDPEKIKQKKEVQETIMYNMTHR